MNARGVDTLTVTLAALAALALYALTAVTTVGNHDSAELALRAWQLGATHAPGAPLHTLTGYLLTRFIESPAAATTLLSGVTTAVTVGLLARLLLDVGVQRGLAAVGALAFATNFIIWGNAVVTELYGPSVMLAAAAIWCGWRWRARGYTGFPAAMTAMLALALGAHFANVLLLPAFGLYVLAGARELRPALLFAGGMALAIALVAAANGLLAANVPPFGRYVPDSLSNLWWYMSGAEHELSAISGLTAGERLAEHARLFSNHYVHAGLVFAAVGVWRQWRDAPAFALLCTLALLGYWGYFTLRGSGDYYLMVAPAYFVVSLWLVLGVAWLWSVLPPRVPAWSAALVPLLLVAIALLTQAGPRRADAVSQEFAAYLDEALRELPPDAVVIARWNEFTALSYRQTVEGARPDLQLLLPARTPRHYPHGRVIDYLPHVERLACVRPVVTNRVTGDMEAAFGVERLAGTPRWMRLRAAAETCTQSSG